MPVFGYRLYFCGNCGHNFKEASKECRKLVTSPCPKCGAECSQWASEPHPEWRVDMNGNLIGAE